MRSLFGLAPGGVYLATTCYHVRGALLPHPFTLTDGVKARRRSTLCCTFRGLSPPRRYLAPCPMEPGLSSRRKRPAIAQLTLARQCRAITARHKSTNDTRAIISWVLANSSITQVHTALFCSPHKSVHPGVQPLPATVLATESA